jgi:hypothetical protein
LAGEVFGFGELGFAGVEAVVAFVARLVGVVGFAFAAADGFGDLAALRWLRIAAGGWQVFFQGLDQSGVLGLGGEVHGLVRVVLLVVELDEADVGGVALAPEGAAPLLSADAVAHEAAAVLFGRARIDADRGLLHRRVGIFEVGLQTHAREAFRDAEAADVGERGIDIDELGRRGAVFACGAAFGQSDEQRCPCGDLEVRVLVPQAVLAELPAVVAPQNDDRVVGEAFFVERIKQAADLSIGEADAGVVAVAQRFGEVGGDGIARRHAGIAVQLAIRVTDEVRRAFRIALKRRDGNRLWIVHVPILLRCDEGQMRLHKAHAEEKRLSGRFERREPFHGLCGHRAVGQFIVGFRADLIRRAFFARFAAFALRDVFERIRELALHAVKLRHRVLGPVLFIHADHFAARKPAWLAPRRSVFKTMMLESCQARRCGSRSSRKCCGSVTQSGCASRKCVSRSHTFVVSGRKPVKMAVRDGLHTAWAQ